MPKLAILTCILIVNLSCRNIQESNFERTKITINDQQFEVLTAWGLFDKYLVGKSNYTDIFNRIKKEFSQDMEYPFLLDAIQGEIKPDENLSLEVKLMKNIDFVKIVDSTFQTVTKELSGPDTKILFIPANPANRKFYQEFGIGLHAFTLGAGKIIVSFDPTFHNWKQLLPYSLAHEYHHSVWTSRNFTTSSFTPLEYVVLEGKADSFANKLFPDSGHPFTNMLDEKTELRIWNLIKPEMNKIDADINNKIMYGTKDIPYGSVYAIGFKIVESFKKNNPLINDRELIDISPKEILLQSKYEE